MKTLDGESASLVATVNAQMKRDFGMVVEPITLHRPTPELMAGAWAALRETVVSGTVDGPAKETVASTVSRVNRCPYCVEAHAIRLAAGGRRDVAAAIERGDYQAIPVAHLRALALWAAASRSPGAPELVAPPFAAGEAPELVGTVVYFHYVNRMVSVFCGDSPLPAVARAFRAPIARVAARRFRRAVLVTHAAGASLGLIADAPVPADLSFAPDDGAIGRAWGAFAAVVDRSGRAALSDRDRAAVRAAIAAWKGDDPPLSGGWIEDALGDADSGAARLALLTALAPYRVGSDDLIELGGADGATAVSAAAWGAFEAARRVAAWLTE
jgi:AhpD family alkylhydroperoxidase